jgi:hypothetical protein
LREVKSIYPELRGVDEGIEDLEIGAAFERKDYEAFVKLSEARWQRQPTSEHAASVASALACRYAVSGDATARTRSETMLHEAESLAKTDDEKKSFAEYRERIEYRLKTRNIIDRQEYDRRFRPQQAQREAS